ncbi:MAG: YidC/Oxa1 family membrane protein insertase [Clostridiales bacterium]|nr:YidC/Oxa1 family membrane protein insertase [Clostridiales bacterium]
MSFLHILYLIALYPIEYLLEMIFSIISKMSGNTILSIVILSLVVNIIVLPLYNRADKIQEEAKDKENAIAPMVKHIKETFTGDERFMLLQTCYRQNNYSPLNVMKSSVSILLQVPFFMGAYNMLSGNKLLAGVSLGPIANLSNPDALITIGGFTLNVLPIVMTLINVVSSLIYAKGFPLKTKIQMYGLAAVFLVLLYQSPSGLVLYWICNNLFSLGKNIVNKIIAKKRKASVAKETAKIPGKLETRYKAVFIFSCLTLAVYTGFYIPVLTVAAAPEEFVNLYNMANPMIDIIDSTAKGFGLFMLWPLIFFALASVKGRKIMSYVMFMLAGSAILNSKLFSNDFGDISNYLEYKDSPSFTLKAKLLSLAVTLAGILVCFLINRFGKYVAPVICLSAAIGFAALGFTNVGKVNAGYREAEKSTTSKAEFTLSKNGKNVIVIMADRAVGPMLPYIFKEKTELASIYDGFTYYHNTASFGTHTNSAVPALLGGYEYTPAAMNERSDKILPEKYDEALKLMPSIFTKNGFDATMVNPTYAGYKWYPDLSVFDGMDNVKAYSTKYSYLPEDKKAIYESEHTEVFRHNLFCYSIFQSAPVALQKALYDGGNYNDTRSVDPSRMISQKRSGNSYAYGHEQTFMWEYYAVSNLDQMTKITDDSSNHFIYYATDLTHDVEMLQEPEYEPRDVVDNKKYDKTHSQRFVRKGESMWMRDAKDYKHYQCDVAAYTLIGKWLEYLKANGVYDNTRIIIVADHGYYLENFPDVMRHDWGATLDGEAFAPLLMVKDFDSHGKLKTSEEFMTNADTPYLATKDVVSNPVNPFTGKAVTDQGKKGTITVFHSNNWNIRNNNGYTYQPGDWFSLKDSIWNIDNWNYLGNH